MKKLFSIGAKVDKYVFVDELSDIPAKEGTADEILFLGMAHRFSASELFGCFEKMHRALKKGGIIRVSAPYYSSAGAWADPRTTRALSEVSFQCFSKKWRKAVGYPDMDCDLEIVNVEHAYNASQKGKSQEAVQMAAMHYWNTIDGFTVTLRKN